jgi:hypothetical protein
VRKLTIDDIADQREYEREREAFRTRVIETKGRRRVYLGTLMYLTFENTETMRFQVQEMARVERINTDEGVAHELETYNGLIPDPGELSGTLFITISATDGLHEWLPRLVGIQDHVLFRLADGTEVRGYEPDAEERLTREDEITTTVHYLKFPFTPDQIARFDQPGTALVVDHPAYTEESVLADGVRRELAADLADTAA